jgi:hypothetical protein
MRIDSFKIIMVENFPIFFTNAEENGSTTDTTGIIDLNRGVTYVPAILRKHFKFWRIA